MPDFLAGDVAVHVYRQFRVAAQALEHLVQGRVRKPTVAPAQLPENGASFARQVK